MDVNYKKMYTHTGDGGFTSLFSGSKVSKSDDRIHAVGSLDELNVEIGSLYEYDEESAHILQNIMFRLMGSVVGGDFITQEDIEWINEQIQKTASVIPTTQDGWVYYGLSRKPYELLYDRLSVVARRAERYICGIENANPLVLTFINALSKFFYIKARFIQKCT